MEKHNLMTRHRAKRTGYDTCLVSDNFTFERAYDASRRKKNNKFCNIFDASMYVYILLFVWKAKS